MSIREDFEQREKTFISKFGTLSSNSRGRDKNEELCPIRTEFQRDRDRIVYSNAFRRLKHKTQVFLSPLGDHYRTRLTHTLEVAQIARTIARAMRFNEDLAEAIALGHDLGHTPFGHSGETVLKKIYSPSFSHTSQSLRVVERLEKSGRGLNLTHEVRDGIIKHSKGFGDILSDDPNAMACTVEGRIVRVADIMAYLNHDLDDAVRGGVVSDENIPADCKKILGKTHPERATTMVRSLIFSSEVEGDQFILKIEPPVHDAMLELRHFLYENVYRSEHVHSEFVKSMRILQTLYEYFLDKSNMSVFNSELKTLEMENCGQTESHERRVCDLIASLADQHALALYSRLFFPRPLV